MFEGNTKDETTVAQVVAELKSVYHIEETTFVGDRGMITRLNVQRIESEGFDYIMGLSITHISTGRLRRPGLDTTRRSC